MEKVSDFISKTVEKSRSNFFCKLVITASLLTIIATDLTTVILVALDSDSSNSIVIYCVFFIFIQFFWSYGSWVMFLLLFYSSQNRQFDRNVHYWELEQRNPVKIFFKMCKMLLMSGKYALSINFNRLDL